MNNQKFFNRFLEQVGRKSNVVDYDKVRQYYHEEYVLGDNKKIDELLGVTNISSGLGGYEDEDDVDVMVSDDDEEVDGEEFEDMDEDMDEDMGNEGDDFDEGEGDEDGDGFEDDENM